MLKRIGSIDKIGVVDWIRKSHNRWKAAELTGLYIVDICIR